MNKFSRILFLGCFIIVATGCQRESIDELSSYLTPGKQMVFSASIEGSEQTRTQLDGAKIKWSANESVNIFYGASSGAKFTSTNTEPSFVVSFEGVLSAFTGITEGGESNSFWSIYPYNATNESYGNYVVANVPDMQKGIENNIPEKAFVMVAKSSGLSLSFKAVSSRLKLKISHPDITRVVVRGNKGETIAGRVSVSINGTGSTEWESIDGESKTEVTMVPASGSVFQEGSEYYLTLLPQTFDEGITVTFYRTAWVGERIVLNPVTFSLTNFNTVNSSKVNTWTPLDHPANEIWYSSFDGREITYDTSFGNDAHIVNEVTETIAPSDNDGVGIIRFASALTVIDKLAFDGEHYLTSIVFPETVTTISAFAFNDCTSLAAVEMGDNVKYIERNAFAGCSFKNIHLSESLLGIGFGAFSWNSELTSITIPESVEKLGYPYFYSDNPFAGCTALESFSGKFATDDGHALLYGNSLSAKDVLVSFAAGALVGGTYDVPDGVVVIAPYAFAGARISGVNLNAVSNIMQYAFNDTALKSVHLTTNVGFINHHAFDGSNQLEYIRIDVTTSLPSVGPEVFDGSTCPIYVPAAWLQVFKTADRWSAYADRYEALPSANEIVYFAENQLTGSSGTYLNHFLSTATSHTFENGCGVLTFASPVTVLPIGAFEGAPITGVILPDGITQIREIAFRGCDQLTSVTLPPSLQYLGTSAFESSGLTSVNIPNTVEHIGTIWDYRTGESTDHDYNPFLGCSNLASFSGKYATSDGLFLVDNGYLVSGAIGAPALGEGQHCVIPSTVTTVGEYALAYGQFTSLSCMNAQVLDINCFYGCSNLSYFEMGYNVTEIRSEAFAIPNGMTGSLAMVNFMLMNDLPEITTDAFKNQNYVELWISGWQATDSAAAMGETWGASPVKEHVRVHQHRDEIWVHFDGTGTITGDFLTDIQNKFLRKDGTVIGLYGYAPLATKFTVIPKSVFPAGIDGSGVYVLKYNGTIQRLAANAFSATGNTLDYISLPNEVTSIGAGAFEGLGLLKKFPGADNDSFYPLNYLTSIGENAFNGCVSMAGSVPMPDVTSLGADAFKNCKALTSVTLGPVSSIPSGAFYECNALQSVTLNVDNLTTIGSEAFYRCNALTKVASADQGSGHVYLPYVTSVGSFAFLSNYGIKNLDLGQYVSSTTLGTGAFDACSSLLTVNMPNVSTVPPMCFFSCSSLNYINALQITSIGNQGFYRCLSLKSLEFPAIVTIGDQAFGQTRSLTTLDLGENLESFGNEVFYDTDSSRRNTNKLSIYLRGTKWYYNEGNTNSIYNWSIWEAFNYNLAEEQAFFRFAAMYVPAQIYADVDQYLQGTFGPLEDL